MSVVEAKEEKIRSGWLEWPWWTMKACSVSLKETKSGIEHHLRIPKCPESGGPFYALIHQACNDVLGIRPKLDRMEIWSQSDCETNPVQNLQKVRSLAAGIKVGADLKELNAQGLRVVGFKSVAPGPNSKAKTILHSFPGVSLDVTFANCPSNVSCGEYLDSQSSKVETVEAPYLDFVTEKECSMWGGEPIRWDALEAKGIHILQHEFGAAGGCKMPEGRFANQSTSPIGGSNVQAP